MKKKRLTLSDNLIKEVIQVKDLFTTEGKTIQVVQKKLMNILRQLGYGVFKRSSKFLTGTLVKQREQVTSELTEADISRDGLHVHDRAALEDDNREELQKSIPTILSKTQIFTLKPIEVDLIKDSKDKAYFTFMNKVVKVTADEIELIDYKNLPACIIDKQKKDFEIADEAESEGDFETFC